VAERIIVIPPKTTRSHGRVVVTGRGGGKVTFLNEDGDLVEGDGGIFIL
jgi:hypothetical protein